MKTAQQVINRAARLAGVLDPRQTLESESASNSLEILNDLLSQLRNSGVELSLDTLTLASNVVVDEADYMAIEYMLAVLIREEFRLAPDIALIARADELKSELQAIYMQQNELGLPLSILYRRQSNAYNIETD